MPFFQYKQVLSLTKKSKSLQFWQCVFRLRSVRWKTSLDLTEYDIYKYSYRLEEKITLTWQRKGILAWFREASKGTGPAGGDLKQLKKQ